MGKLEREAQILKRFNNALAAFNAVLDQLGSQRPAIARDNAKCRRQTPPPSLVSGLSAQR